MNETQDQAIVMNEIHATAAGAVAARAVERAPKFQKFVSTVLDNAKGWTNGERSHISDGETSISSEEIRLLLGGDLWDLVEADVKENLEDEIRDEVREELEDEMKDEIRDEVLREVQDAISNL
jgi:hemerythrin-like domain-containing protein